MFRLFPVRQRGASRFYGGLLVAAALGSMMPAAAQTQAYPARSVRMLVGFPPGGGTDSIARVVATELAQRLKQPFVVENKGGANGVIATTELVKAPADGYTLMMTISSHVTNAVLYPGLKFDALKDVAPISIVATSPFVLIAHPSFAANNVKELIALARTQKITYGSPGPGSTQHLSMELMDSMADISMTHIGYRGGAPALTDLLAGQVPLMFMTTVQSLPYLKDKRIKALAMSSATRTPVLPDVPTIAESGVPNYHSDVWFGVIAPGGTPQAVIDTLHEEIVKMIADPAVQEKLRAQGAEPVGDTPQAFAERMKAEYATWAPLIKKTGIKAD